MGAVYTHIDRLSCQEAGAFASLRILRRTLTEEQRKELEEVMDEQLALFPLEQAESFIKGFRLGAGIMMEVLSPPAK